MHEQLTSKALAPALIPLTTFPNKNDICAKDLSRKEKKNIYQLKHIPVCNTEARSWIVILI